MATRHALVRAGETDCGSIKVRRSCEELGKGTMCRRTKFDSTGSGMLVHAGACIQGLRVALRSKTGGVLAVATRAELRSR